MDLLFTILPFAIVLYCVYSIYKAVSIGTKKKDDTNHSHRPLKE